MKKTLAFYLTLVATVLAALALVLYLSSGIVMPYVTTLNVAALAAGVIYLLLYKKLAAKAHLSLLISVAAVLMIGAVGFSLISEVESLGYLISGLRQWADVRLWVYFAVAGMISWIILLVSSFLNPADKV